MAKHYYIGVINEREGEYNYDTHVMFSLVVNQPDLLDQSEIQTADRLAKEKLEDIASYWFPEYDDETNEEIPMEKNDQGWYEHAGGEVWITAGRIFPIKRDTFMDLKEQHVMTDFTEDNCR